MQDYETLICEVIEEHDKSARSLWRCAELVYELYSRYGRWEKDFTALLSSQMAVGADSLYHWSKAWSLRLQVLEAYPNFDISGLSISHFYTASDYVKRQGVEWVADWLVVAQESRWSSRRLGAELSTACDNSGEASWLMDKLALISGRLSKLYGSSAYAGLSEPKRRRLRRVLLLLDGVIK